MIIPLTFISYTNQNAELQVTINLLELGGSNLNESKVDKNGIYVFARIAVEIKKKKTRRR